MIDTVWAPFAEDFVDNLAKEIDLDKIDFIVANHGEIDIAARSRVNEAHPGQADLLHRKCGQILKRAIPQRLEF